MSAFKVSAFIRTYRGDFAWLKCCLQSLEIYGLEFSEIVVAVPEVEFREFMETVDFGLHVRPVSVPVHTVNGYIDQQITKCHADLYCKGDFIMHFDSDCVAHSTINLPCFFDANGLPKILFRRWQDAGDAEAWRLVTRGVLGQEPPFETMASHPFVYHRSTHELFRRHVADIHGGDFLKYASRVSQFSEFNAIGNFALLFTPDAYRFIRAGAGDLFPRPFRQYWSRDPRQLEEAKRSL